jgi:hypothetical protein
LEQKGTSPGHEAIRLDAVLKAVELPARIPHLDARLSDVDAYDLPHLCLSLFSASASPSTALGVHKQQRQQEEEF